MRSMFLEQPLLAETGAHWQDVSYGQVCLARFHQARSHFGNPTEIDLRAREASASHLMSFGTSVTSAISGRAAARDSPCQPSRGFLHPFAASAGVLDSRNPFTPNTSTNGFGFVSTVNGAGWSLRRHEVTTINSIDVMYHQSKASGAVPLLYNP